MSLPDSRAHHLHQHSPQFHHTWDSNRNRILINGNLSQNHESRRWAFEHQLPNNYGFGWYVPSCHNLRPLYPCMMIIDNTSVDWYVHVSTIPLSEIPFSYLKKELYLCCIVTHCPPTQVWASCHCQTIYDMYCTSSFMESTINLYSKG